MSDRKDIFTALGRACDVEGRPHWTPLSNNYFVDCLSRVPKGPIVAVTFSTKIPSRSKQQHKYYWRLLRLLGKHTGHAAEELHNIFMVELFGETLVIWKGKTFTMRQSESDSANLAMEKMSLLIEHVKAECDDQGVKVMTFEEAGGISNY